MEKVSEVLVWADSNCDTSTPSRLITCLYIRSLTSEDGFNSDVDNGNPACDKEYKCVGQGVLLEPGGTVGLPVAELQGNNLEVNCQELTEAVAVHQTESAVFGLALVC
jgi:hypothetical protein